ncbi:hypothetical protein DL98DRAFT_662382 [Cadophora sp. DSE1049]|nr:hypothetical protein DL98DRAFT_662382 [Cadophora sp. DSE1049]
MPDPSSSASGMTLSGDPPSGDQSQSARPKDRTASCERCKSQKLRCDRQKPSCQRCAKAQASCRYSGRRRPGFPAGQRQYLEDKISRLENEARRAQESSKVASDASIQSSDTPNSEPTSTVIPDLVAKPQAPDTDPDALPIATVEKTRSLAVKDPPADLLFSLTALFFRHVHPWLPFLDPQQVFADMGSTTNIPLLYFALFGASIPYSRDSRLDPRSSDSFWTHSKRRIFVDILEEPSLTALEALTILTLDLSGMTNGPQVWGALAIAVRFSLQLRPIGNRVLRLSPETRINTPLSASEQTNRCRLFWAIYALDSYITITTGHLSDLSEDHASLFLPTRNATWGLTLEPIHSPGQQRDDNGLGDEQAFSSAPTTFIFAYQLMLLDISRKIHKNHVQKFSSYTEADPWGQDFIDCSNQLFEWFMALPKWLLLNETLNGRPKSPGSRPSLLMLHAYYHALVIQLQGVVAYPMNEVDNAQLPYQPNESQSRCMRSIESMLTISRMVVDNAVCEKLGWPFAWSLWVACRYLLVRNINEGLNELESFSVLLGCLKTLSRYSQIGAKYWRLLTQAAAESQAQSSTTPSSRYTLLAVTDLRIPTSDLEDQARPDPVIYTVPSADGSATQICTNFDFDVNMQNFNESISEGTFAIPGFVSDNWYGASLFPSYGYQQ